MSDENKVVLFNEQSRQQLFRQRIVVLDGQLNDDNGTLLATQILTLAAEDADTDIALWIHSPGGSVPSMLAIRDVMRLVPCDVATLVLGLACSAGQFLLSAGTPGKRFALIHGDNPAQKSKILEAQQHDYLLQGHTHVNEIVTWKGVPYITSGAVCGNWWHGTHLGTPEGFTVVTVANGKLTTRYETYGFKSIAPQNT